VLDALYIGATGMHAQQMQVDTIANNLANVNTPSYKKARVSFTELVGRQAVAAGTGAGPLTPTQSLGSGVAMSSLAKLFETGEIKKTDSAMDVAIQGDGFLEVAMPDGSHAYTRGGTLKVNADGQLATLGGLPLKPGIAIPDNAEAIVISSGGRVQVRLPGQSGLVDVGEVELVRFANVQGLLSQGAGVYRSSEASGEAIGGRAGMDGMGSIVQGALEGSNVKLVEEMVSLMMAQRAYEASVRVVQASDDMLGMINGLRR
jgi:flagellar basal-body rod protein FlgG